MCGVCIPPAMVSSLVEIIAINPNDSQNPSTCTMATFFLKP